jgi:hypothetical protein
MNRGAALTGALLVTLASPATWPLALAAFLIRGGLLVVALPIVVLPTAVGLGNILAPTLTSVAFGGVSLGFVILAATIALAGLAWIIVGGLLAALLEAEAARILAAEAVATDEAVAADEAGAPGGFAGRLAPEAMRPRRAESGRILVARLLADLPLGVALAWGSARIVAVTYRELTNPFDVANPLIWRVLRGSPEVVVAIVLTWVVGQTLGAIAARRIALGGSGIFGALGGGLATMLRRPLTVLADFSLPSLALALALTPSVVAAASAGDVVRAAMSAPADPVEAFLGVALFVSLWMIGLTLTGVICAWRAAVWTVRFSEGSR